MREVLIRGAPEDVTVITSRWQTFTIKTSKWRRPTLKPAVTSEF